MNVKKFFFLKFQIIILSITTQWRTLWENLNILYRIICPRFWKMILSLSKMAELVSYFFCDGCVFYLTFAQAWFEWGRFLLAIPVTNRPKMTTSLYFPSLVLFDRNKCEPTYVWVLLALFDLFIDFIIKCVQIASKCIILLKSSVIYIKIWKTIYLQLSIDKLRWILFCILHHT